MITEVFISSISNPEELENGINLVINRCNDNNYITVSLKDDGEKSLLPCTFEIKFKELKDAVKKLEYIDDEYQD